MKPLYKTLVTLVVSLAAACDDQVDDQVDEPGHPDAGAASAGGADEWTRFGGDLHHTRANLKETLINVDSVGSLSMLWEVEAPGVTVTPVVKDGVVYWSDWAGGIHATAASSGASIWSVQYPESEKSGASGTPVLQDGFLYLVTRAGTALKLDAGTGEEVWSTSIEAGPHILIYGSPTLADGTLIIGVCGNGSSSEGEPVAQEILDTFRGSVQGIDAETGAINWVFETTHFDSQQYAAGVGVWSTATVDETLAIAYIGTGNGYDTPVSPLSDSLLALDYTTGEYVWHVQYTRDDAYRVNFESGGRDADVGAAPNLFEIDGRPVVGVGDKSGIYHVHDRADGALVWQNRVRNGWYVGGIIAPAAVHGDRIYVASNNGGDDNTNFTVALDRATGEKIWQQGKEGTRGFGGPTYAGGVVFAGDGGTSRGSTVPGPSTLYAYDAETGDTLWSETLPSGRGGGVSVVGGRLFVGYGFHFQVPSAMPVLGGLRAYAPEQP